MFPECTRLMMCERWSRYCLEFWKLNMCELEKLHSYLGRKLEGIHIFLEYKWLKTCEWSHSYLEWKLEGIHRFLECMWLMNCDPERSYRFLVLTLEGIRMIRERTQSKKCKLGRSQSCLEQI